MLRSMTAFGRSSVISPLVRLGVEIQSVNRKHLEINTSLPNEFLRFDVDVKNIIAQRIGRGQINIKVSAHFEREAPLTILPNLPLAKQIKAAWEKIGRELQLTTLSDSLWSILSKEENLIVYSEELKEEEAYCSLLREAVSKAMDELIERKDREGLLLQQDIFIRLEKIALNAAKIALKAPKATERYREKLISRLMEVSSGNWTDNEDKVLREIAIYAEKIDIAEELKRFDCHLSHFNTLLSSEEKIIGKTLDFIIQELNREMNTITSKSSDYDVAHCVVETKSELERIREQIQNVE